MLHFYVSIYSCHFPCLLFVCLCSVIGFSQYFLPIFVFFGTAIVNHKEPISSSVIHDIISRSNLKNPVELRNITLYVLSFADFFTFDDVSRIRRNDLFFNEGFMVI